MSRWQWITIVFTAAVVVAVFGYDVLAMYKGGMESSISHLMIVWAYKYPVFPFLMGLICGHLFWRMKETPETKKVSKDGEE